MRNLGSHQRYSALSIDCPAKFLVPQLMAGVQLQFQPDLDRADLLLAIGVNTVVSHGHGVMVPNPLGRLRDVRARGGRVVVIDPRRSESARHADLHVAPRPGTDAFVVAHLVREALRRGGDAEFLHACVDAPSLPRLAAAVDAFDAATAAAIAGVPVADLRALDALVAGAGRVAIETGTGVMMNRHANLTEWLVWALAAVTGSLDRPGGVTFNPGSLRRFEEPSPAGAATSVRGRPAGPTCRGSSTARCRARCSPTRSAAGTSAPLLVRVGNPALAIAGQPALHDALRELDVLVAIDVRPTETTALATHVLPMTDHFERGDLLSGYLQAQPFLRYAPPVLAPVGERRPQWWMFAELAQRLGMPRFGSARRDAALADRDVDDEAVAESIMASARRPWAEVRASSHGIRDDSVAPGWLVPGRLPHLLDVAPVELVAQLAACRAATPTEPDRASLVLINRRTSQQYNSLHREVVGRGRPATPSLLLHPDDAAPATCPPATSPRSARATARVVPSSRSPTRSGQGSSRSPTASGRPTSTT